MLLEETIPSLPLSLNNSALKFIRNIEYQELYKLISLMETFDQSKCQSLNSKT